MSVIIVSSKATQKKKKTRARAGYNFIYFIITYNFNHFCGVLTFKWNYRKKKNLWWVRINYYCPHHHTAAL